ncbi:hypothetical protein MSAN_01076000 [Mycena sanguinolenta]|uniref:F-box domain-containing protein n=1 Tax=Mycena sanguinolenta TaxID=230812 RepID=A0A8H7D967_9AGAR|nr:hypothetical protein MSAN_01076000 [Mycena sanguinolenta]
MSSLELPSELWLKVFCDLPFESLLNIHAVSWLFSDLSTNFIFEDVHFYPRESSIARTKRAIQREFHRATFWSSDKVAPHVRKCTVELTWISSGSMVAEFAPQLLSAYFEAVSRFKNLEKLCCSLHNPTNIDLPPLRVEKSLSRLRVLDIRGVRLAPQTSPAIRLKLEDLSYADIHSSQSIGSDFLLSFDPTYLRRLCLELQSMSFLHDLLPDKHAMASFHYLHVLELRLQVTNIVDLHACLSSFPGIHDLTLQVWRIDAGFVPSTPLAPELRTYKGPMDLIPALDLGSSVLRTLTLTDGDSRVLLRKLREIRLGNSVVTAITSLTMLVRQWYIPETDSNLRDTLSFFPALQTLSLTMYSHHFIDQRPIHATFPQELCGRLAVILPVVHED